MRAVIKQVGIAAALTVAAALPVKAQVITNINASGSTTINIGVPGWTATISNCQNRVNGTLGNCSADEVIASVVGSTLSLVFQNQAGTGTPLTYSTGTSATNTQLGDITINLVITAPAGQSIFRTSTNLTGSAPSGFASYVTANGSLGATTTLGNSPTLATATFAPVSSVSPATDSAAHGEVATVAAGGQVTLSSVTFTYTAPEPVSLSLFAVGLAGLGFVRRKIRQPH